LDIQTSRMLGGIGACFTVIGAVSGVSSLVVYAHPGSAAINLALTGVSGIVGVLGFVGFILFFMAMYGFSKAYGEHRIFNYILYGLIIAIVAAVVAAVIMFAFIFANLVSIIPSLNPQATSQTQITNLILTYLAPFLAVFGFIALINVMFNVWAFNLLADKSKVPLFRTGAKVLLAGALVTVVLGIIFAVITPYVSLSFNTPLILAIPGGLVQDAAWVLLAISFFRIKALTTQTFTPSSVPTLAGQVKYCPNCGAQNRTDAMYCMRCGQKL
jgi:uncharacterized membrane protein